MPFFNAAECRASSEDVEKSTKLDADSELKLGTIYYWHVDITVQDQLFRRGFLDELGNN